MLSSKAMQRRRRAINAFIREQDKRTEHVKARCMTYLDQLEEETRKREAMAMQEIDSPIERLEERSVPALIGWCA